MRSTWTDSRLDEFAKSVDRRFDKVDDELIEIRESIGALQRTIFQVGGGMLVAFVGLLAAMLGLIATQL